MEELLAAAAEAMNVPVEMVERSAQARANARGVAIEDVLRAWSSGVEITDTAPVAESGDAPADIPAAVEAPPAPEPASAVPVAMDEASIVAAAAEKMGMPESMVRRSAAARARAQGVDVDVVLMDWAGVDASAAAPAAAAPAAPAAAPAATSEPAAVQPAPAVTAPAEPVSVAAIEPEVLGGSDEPAASEPPDPPDRFESEEEATAGGAIPRWLVALFVLVPVFAIGYALFLPNGPNCGDAGSLAIDPVIGLAVNCDGSEFGSELLDLFSLGAEIYNGAGCTACHGPNGGGNATFPAFIDGALLATFPQDSCSAQVEWIGLGTTGWPESTYGANEKPVGGSGAVMPGFGSSLSSQEIAAVALYERVAFGGQGLDEALVDCGGETTDEASALGE